MRVSKSTKIAAIRFVKQALSHLAIYQLLSGELFNSDEHFIVSARGWEILKEIEENKNPGS